MYRIDLVDRVIPDLFAARVSEQPESDFLHYGQEKYTYQEAYGRVGALVHQFREQGIESGSTVLLLMNNSDAMVFSVLALLELGAIVTPVNTSVRGDYLRYFVQDSESSHAIVDAELIENLLEILDGSQLTTSKIFVHSTGINDLMNESSLGVHRLSVSQRMERQSTHKVSFRDPAFIIYTSGTTGRSKGVVATHAHSVSLGMVLPRLQDLTSDDRLLIYMPMFHASSLWSSMLSAICIGASIAVLPKFSASKFWDQARELGATQFVAMGVITEILMLQKPSESDRNHRIRVAYSAPLPKDPAAFEERFGVALASGYGMTELPPVANSKPRAGYHHRSYLGPIQREFSDVRIHDENDLPLPVGQVGEIVVRPRDPWTSMIGYLGKPEETLKTVGNLWFHTGDLGWIDDNDQLYFQGRKSEVIRRRGEFVSPLELEEQLGQCLGLEEVAAFPVPSELGEDDVAVAVTLTKSSTLSAEQIHDYALENLPRHMVPRYIDLRDDLPKTPTGKVEKAKLAREITDGLRGVWDAGARATRR